MDIFLDLRDLAELDRQEPKSSQNNAIQDSDRLLLTELKLVTLAKNPNSNELVSSTCIATIIFLDNHLRGVSFNARIMDRFVFRLQSSMNAVLDTISPFDIDIKIARIVLWILYVGGAAAENKSERAWFVTHLSYFSDSLQIDSWENLREILQSFLWPLDWEQCGILLWEEVDKDRASINLLLSQEELMANLDWPLQQDE